MQKTSTKPVFLNRLYQPIEPRHEILCTIMAFANTYNVEKLDNGETVCYFSN